MSEAPLEFAVALAGAFARFGSQHFASDSIPHNALAQLARAPTYSLTNC